MKINLQKVWSENKQGFLEKDKYTAKTLMEIANYHSLLGKFNQNSELLSHTTENGTYKILEICFGRCVVESNADPHLAGMLFVLKLKGK